MSTILDALKKVESERPQSTREQLLHVDEPETARRRPLSLGVIVGCATLGFATGIGLALWRNAPPVDVPPPLQPAPAPVNEVPPPPLVPPDVRVAAAPPVADAIEKPAEPPPAGVPAGDAATLENDAVADAPPARPSLGTAATDVAVPAPPASIAATAEDSALEPSPFARGAGQGAPDARAARAPSAPEPVEPLALAPREMDDTIPAEEPPTAEAASEEQPAPTAAPEPALDTGRSPPGAPKVLLSFLQWSEDPRRRFAFVSIDGAPSQRIREGETAGGMTVAQITPTGVQFDREGKRFTIRTRH
jgi:hypothetical protein